MNMSYCCSEFSPAIAIVRFLDFGHSNRYIVVSHGVFNEIFLVTNDIECIFILINHLFIFFGDMSVLLFCLLKPGYVLIVEC